MVIKHCAPTLAGIKTGNIFSCDYSSRQELTDDIRRINQKLVPKGIRVIPLRFSEGRVLIYVFRPNHLASDLSCEEARQLLQETGYRSERTEQCILELIHRLNSCQDFPHEIGLFLSYPPEDVKGFIQNDAKNCKCVGCWKVYGDEAAARAKFARYRECTEIYCRQWAMGHSVEQLAVAV